VKTIAFLTTNLCLECVQTAARLGLWGAGKCTSCGSEQPAQVLLIRKPVALCYECAELVADAFEVDHFTSDPPGKSVLEARIGELRELKERLDRSRGDEFDSRARAVSRAIKAAERILGRDPSGDETRDALTFIQSLESMATASEQPARPKR
jgi:hypothetical protein